MLFGEALVRAERLAQRRRPVFALGELDEAREDGGDVEPIDLDRAARAAAQLGQSLETGSRAVSAPICAARRSEACFAGTLRSMSAPMR